MSFFEDASLVLIPSAQKTSKVYSIKPTDGTGDLTFTRSNDTATRVNSAGLIEKVRTNFALQSQNFSSATWLKPASVTYGESDPFGGTNAALVQFDASASSAMAQANFSITSGVTYTISAWIKGVNLSGLRMVFANNQVIDVFSQVVNGSWVRIKATTTATATGTFFAEFARANNTSAQSFYIYGAQYEISDFGPTDYIETTSAAVSVGPVANVPRLDYLGSSCPRLLLEPQRTNLVQFSESFDNAWWQLKTDVTISANTSDTADPSGYYGADKITETATLARHRLATNTLTTAATAYAGSIFMKAGTARYAFLHIAGVHTSTIVVDLQTGTVTDAQSSGSINSYNVEDYGGGWYKVTIVEDLNSVTTAFQMQFGSAGAAQPSTYNNYVPQFTGSASNYFYAWGAQLEAGAYATSYIPTLASASTRGSDSASKTGISSLIGQTEGTMFFEGTIEGINPTTARRIISLSDGTNNNLFQVINLDNSLDLRCELRSGGSSVFTINASSAFSLGQKFKFAFAYANNDFAFYINGVQAGTSTSGSAIATSVLQFARGDGANPFEGTNSQLLLFKTRLTNAQLAELTTL